MHNNLPTPLTGLVRTGLVRTGLQSGNWNSDNCFATRNWYNLWHLCGTTDGKCYNPQDFKDCMKKSGEPDWEKYVPDSEKYV